MAVSEKDKLMDEYVAKFFRTFRMLEVTGFSRFIIRNSKIVARNWSSMVYNMLVLTAANACAISMMLVTNIGDEVVTTIELITVVYFTIFANIMMFQITFDDKYSGPKLIQNCIEIDHFLGVKETEFMRKLEVNMYIFLVIFVGFAQVGVTIYLYYIFDVSYFLHFTGTLYFFWILFAYDDYCFFIYFCVFLTTRARYINVALLKITNMKMEYIPKQSFFYSLFWRVKNENRVTFHVRADNKDFVIALKMLFHQLRHIERCYRLPMIGGVFTLEMGSFVTVQTFILFTESSTAIMRVTATAGWVVATWVYFFVVSLLTDMFNKQIEQTKLICAYIQLKPTSSEEMLKLTKDIISSLEMRDARFWVYNIFVIDTGFVFKLAASTFVYITVQLQLTFPIVNEGHTIDNVTNPASYDQDYNKMKEFVFLY